MVTATTSSPLVISLDDIHNQVEVNDLLARACDEADDMAERGFAAPLLFQCREPTLHLIDHHSQIPQFERTLRRIESLRTPVGIAVDGRCVGVIIDIIAVADFRVATAGSVFALASAHGIALPAATLHRLCTQLPSGLIRSMALLGSEIGARDATKLFLIDEIVDDFDQALSVTAQRFSASQDGWPKLPMIRQLLRESKNLSPQDAIGVYSAAVALFQSRD